MAMDCRDISPLLSPHLDGELSVRVAQAVADHLQTCALCEARQTQLVSARDAVRQWPEEFVSPAFSEQLNARLAGLGVEATPAGLSRSHRFVLGLTAVAIAAMLLLIVVPARRIMTPGISRPAHTSGVEEMLGTDCGLASAMHCHAELLCSSAVACGDPSQTTPALVTAN